MIDEVYQNKKSFKIFTIKLEEGKTYRIEEVSPIFFAYLYLEDPSGNIVDEHDGGGRDQAARLVYQATESGIYRIIATSQAGVKNGAFSLSIRIVHELGGNLPPQSLPPWFKELDKDQDGQVSLHEWLLDGRNPDAFLLYDINGDGFITPEEFRRVVKKVKPHLKLEQGRVNCDTVLEKTSEDPYENKKVFKIFTIKLEEGKTYEIEQISPAFFAYLYLEDPNGEIVDENNSGGRGKTARIVHQATETGLYRLIATSQDGVKTGDFSLSVCVIPNVDDPPKELPTIRITPTLDDILPKGLPTWFKELDKNQEGQVSLQDWLRDGRSREDFRHYDRNGDGFITPDEVLWVLKRAENLTFNRGKINYQGAIEEATDERYENKKTFKIFTIKLDEGITYQIEQVSQVFYAYLYLEDPTVTSWLSIIAVAAAKRHASSIKRPKRAFIASSPPARTASRRALSRSQFALFVTKKATRHRQARPRGSKKWTRTRMVKSPFKNGSRLAKNWKNSASTTSTATVLSPVRGSALPARPCAQPEKGNYETWPPSPEGLPPWFKELDKDQDGQSLYRSGSKAAKKGMSFASTTSTAMASSHQTRSCVICKYRANSEKKGKAKAE